VGILKAGISKAGILKAKSGGPRLTPLELEIMQVLWESGPSTVADVLPKLKAELAYTTVQTMLGVLLRKGKVKRKQEGRAFRYSAAVSRQKASGSAVEDLLRRMFGGSPEALVLSMIEARQITAEELNDLAAKLAASEQNGTVENGKGENKEGE
jgi:BlaI family transcriptional regulator, penicillinase repressor